MNFEERRKLPIIEWTFEDDDMDMGMDAISFVDYPATEVNWKKFNNNQKLKFEKKEQKRIVTGPIMVANKLIYRESPTMGGYYGKFSESTIEKMMIKYFKEGKMNRVNENHESNRVVKDVFLIESYILGDNVDSKIFENLSKGTWMGSFYVENKEYWDNVIMKDEFNGFSLEGMFMEQQEEAYVTEVYNEIKRLVDTDITDEEFKAILKKKLNIK